ncbi:MAG TPA: tetratricopeptide repeat protein [Candidatus Hydrogenedentes bacterium]|nr:tetratricopeptide repeat protein [Candidatus Hydrogenedentota bacterium]
MRNAFLFAIAAAVVAPVAVHADVQLWVSYYYQGVESYNAGKYRDAQALLNKAHTETCAAHRQAFTLDSMGMNHMALTEYAEAEKCFQSALCLRKDECGEESRFVPATLNNLADLHYIAGNVDKVECLYKEALDINGHDPYSVEVGRSLNGLALVAADAGNIAEAENLLKRAVKVHFHGGRSEHPYMATVLTNLGILYTEQGKYEEAAEALKKAKRIQYEVLGKNHPDVAIRLHAEANLHVKSGGCACHAKEKQDKANAIRESFTKLNAKQG